MITVCGSATSVLAIHCVHSQRLSAAGDISIITKAVSLAAGGDLFF